MIGGIMLAVALYFALQWALVKFIDAWWDL